MVAIFLTSICDALEQDIISSESVFVKIQTGNDPLCRAPFNMLLLTFNIRNVGLAQKGVKENTEFLVESPKSSYVVGVVVGKTKIFVEFCHCKFGLKTACYGNSEVLCVNMSPKALWGFFFGMYVCTNTVLYSA